MAESTQEYRAQARWVRCSPQKARLVLDLIKGRRVEDAMNTLAFTKKRIAERVEKLLRSAVENVNYLSAEKGLDVDVDNLYVKNAVANDGPRMKRIRPAPQGRAFRYQRRMSHIEIALAEKLRADGTARHKAAATAKATAGKSKTAGKTAGKPAAKKAAKKSPAKKFAGKK
jgi:large subunit ribosomal protein L22